MKILKKDYPFTIMIEDKVGKNSGKMYQSVSVGYTSVKNKDATSPQEKYETKWLNFFDERDLLKLQAVASSAYDAVRNEKSKPVAQPTPVVDDLDTGIPF
jgi:hypothetical protein